MAERDNPTLADLCRLLHRNISTNTHVAKPGTVLSFDWTPRPRARIQIGHKMRTRSGETFEVPPIANVPVLFMSWGPLTMRAALKRGDGVLCIVMDRAFTQWLVQGGRVPEPESGRQHALNDIVAIPMLRPTASEPKVQPAGDELYIGDDLGLNYIKVNAQTQAIEINTTSLVEIKSQGPVNVESPSVTLGNIGSPSSIARIGDQVVIPSGSSAGTYPIVPGVAFGGTPSAHTTRG